MLPPRASPERLVTPHGAVVLVELGDDDALDRAMAALPPAERAYAEKLGPVRRSGHVAGRTALHLALGDGYADAAILADDRGAPMLPAGWVGSVSHKGALAAVLVAPAGDGWVGVDLERAAPPRIDISRRVLTPRELELLAEAEAPVAGGGGSGEWDAEHERGCAVTLRFAIKEAIYKAIDPHLRRYVGFLEVELELDGERCAVAHALPLAIEAAWR
ncbi:MAG TPA: 4'-phosphopantetheinyl transferase superfamily protein, partial [Kofleriaceae bacterium]|nr:4'-phosphopantetheinyl transferase superfamily protein [Kofleriaceae bacterium]